MVGRTRWRHWAATRLVTAVWLTWLVPGVGVGQAQILTDCRSPQPRSIGAAVGRSLPYVELDSSVASAEPGGTVSVRSGAQVAARADLPLAGPLRIRVEGGTTRWDVRRIRYDEGAGFRVIGDTSIDRMAARHLVALVGVRLGRAPVCAHVSVGPGVYSIGLEGGTVRRAGVAIAAGMEIPTGHRGVVQLDATLHQIGTQDTPPIGMTSVPALNLLAGWAYRF